MEVLTMTGYPHKPAYWVDWSDRTHPEIRHKSHPAWTPYNECKSFREARKEVTDYFRNMIEHARSQVLKAERTRIPEVKADAEKARNEGK